MTTVGKNNFPEWTVDIRGNVDKDDNNDEHFKGADSTTQSFVRENTQNINDVIRNDVNEPARIRLFISGKERAVPKDISAKYFSRLGAHLDVCSSKAGLDSKVMSRNCQYLVVEDFNTTGLTGNPHSRHEKEGSGNNFYGFFRSAGKSAKTSGGGSWGVGKIVNNMASSVGAFFGYSVRMAEQGTSTVFPRVLMGRATLTTHELDGHLHSPDAFFAIRENDDLNAFPLPITDDKLLDTFVADWRLSRRSTETGLSIVVPYCDKNIDANAVPFYLIAETYGFVLNGRMTLEIDIPGLKETISAESLESFIESRTREARGRDWAELLEKVRLTKWACSQNRDKDTIQLPMIQSPVTANAYAASLSEEIKTAIKSQFSEHGKVKIRAQVNVEGKWDDLENEPSQMVGNIELSIGAVDSTEALYPEYFRDWLRIGVGLRHRKRGERPMGTRIPQVQALLVVQGGKTNGLSLLLRASEGIAHSKWGEVTKGFEQRFGQDGEKWISLAKDFPTVFADIARGIDAEIDHNAFPFLADDEHTSRDEKKPTKNKRQKPTDPPPPPTPTVSVSPIDRGFSVSLPPANPPDFFEIKSAYAVTSGSPFSTWSPADFAFTTLDVKHKGCTIIIRQGNLMEVEVVNPDDFALTVTGFNPNKDLVVIAKPPSDEPQGDDE